VAGRWGTRATLASGLLLCAAGLGLLVLLSPLDGVLRLLPGLVLFGAGAGLVNPTMTVAALAAVPPDQGGMASGVNNAARQFGIAAGIAGFGAAVQAAVSGGVAGRLAGAGVEEQVARAAGARAADGLLAPGPGVSADALAAAYRGAYADALDLVLLLGVGIAVLGTAVVLVLIRTPQPAAGPCGHLDRGHDVVPGDDGCHECLQVGTPYRELRLCRTCGHVGCCDSSPGRHATAHYRATGHPVVQSTEPGESWYWCYVDRRLFELTQAKPVRER
jgi:hypothetical protein